MRFPFLLTLLATCTAALAEPVEIPLDGNAYVTEGDGRNPHRLEKPDSVVSLFFHSDRAADLKIAVRAQGEGSLALKAAGKTSRQELNGKGEPLTLAARAAGPGYVRVDLQGAAKAGQFTPVTLDSLTVDAGDGAKLSYVYDNVDNHFYWGRRGASVHLGYALPAGEPVEHFYNEVTVPKGSDPVGSYFMANGFAEGYFGMQVNGERERRILFSVWSPFSTNHPETIPADQKVVLLKKGEGVHGGEFGGEGSGGQSYWVYPWKAGETYRFLNRVHPDGKGATQYSAWFYVPETRSWKLIASFLRPHTDTTLKGAHSFLENFSDWNGYQPRAAWYGNQWACDTSGKWHAIHEAGFSRDDIGQRKWRLDCGGGVEGNRFILRNGGYSVTPSTPERLTRDPGQEKAPEIDLKALEDGDPNTIKR